MKLVVLLLSVWIVSVDALASDVEYAGSGARSLSWAKELCKRRMTEDYGLPSLKAAQIQWGKQRPEFLQPMGDGAMAVWTQEGLAVWNDSAKKFEIKAFDKMVGTSEQVAEKGFPVFCKLKDKESDDPIGDLIEKQASSEKKPKGNAPEGRFKGNRAPAAEDYGVDARDSSAE